MSVRIEECGVADLIFIYAKVVMQKDSDTTWRSFEIRHAHSPKVNIFVAGDRIVAVDLDAESIICEDYVGDKSLRQILERAAPPVLKDPRKLAVNPNAKPKRETLRVVFLPDMRKIDVADLVFIVEI
ncbi:MAG: hypothetical protein IPO41_14805 [Acidobacteria bacterium]|nr:hypothetical protein [Acidobacteriota bacterium]